ncbi:MAG: hypothetical protein FGM37_04140, partial [Phycisphaerales bacterium]|nr:hypothetical protein [Phycisphaerales bacterium]
MSEPTETGQATPEPARPRTEAPQAWSDDDFVDEQPFRVLAIVNTLLRQRWWIVGIAGFVTSVAIVMMLLATPVFTATAKFLPSQSSAMSSRMGAIIEGQVNVGRGDDPSTDYYVALVQSPSFLQGVVVRPLNVGEGEPQTLVDYYKVPEASESERVRRAADRLAKSITVSAAKVQANPMLPR